jgi:proteasome lid subunit RPN8/RPN11
VSSTLILPTALCEHLASEARAAFPNECCGLIEGVATSEGWRAMALHGSKNLAAYPARRFLIDPQVHFELLRTLRGTDRAIIGCYHSHPDGRVEPSARDRDEAMDGGFVWLIIAGNALGAYVFDTATRDFAPLTLGPDG